MSLPRHLRSYKEKSKDEVSRDFFNIPTQDAFVPVNDGEQPMLAKSRKEDRGGLQGMDINAVLSVEGKEEVYVSGHSSYSYP